MKTSIAQSCLVAVLLAGGCSTGGSEPNHPDLAGVRRAEASVAHSPDGAGNPPAIFLGETLSSAELMPRLSEAAGAVVLEEILLGRQLDRQLSAEGLKIAPQDVQAEESQLLDTMGAEARLNPEQVQEMVTNLRQNRGLGPVRFADLMSRNAKLRALVREQLEVTSEDVEQALAVEFGPKLNVRLIAVTSAKQAGAIREEIVGSTSAEGVALVTTRFAYAAVRGSTDSSAARGGLVEQISPLDPALSPQVRQGLESLQPGIVSPVIASDGRYLLLLLDSKVEGRGVPTPADRAKTEARVRSRKERIAMDRLARQLLSTSSVSVMDPSLRWSWEARPRE